jgi:hypothetical protein
MRLLAVLIHSNGSSQVFPLISLENGHLRERLKMLASFIALLMKFFSSTANVKLLMAALAKLSAALG